jgi:polyisoprenoid-binding protein YceI
MNVSRPAVLVVLLAALAALPSRAEPRVLVLDPGASRVSFTLGATGHNVEGTMAVQSGRIAFDPATGAASGEIAIDLKSARTGNSSRDKTMHQDVLETPKYPLAVFHAEKLTGAVPVSGSGQVTLEGTLSFHGADHKMKLPAKVDVQNGHVQAQTRFPIPYVQWGLHDPSILILRVEKVVSVNVQAEGSLQEAGEAPAGVK